MKKILIVCPTRSRVEKCLRMHKSMIKNIFYWHDFDILYLVDECDPALEEYKHAFKDMLLINKRDTITNRINEAFKENMDYQYFHLTNDDFVYNTPNWDLLLINGMKKPGVSYGNDGVNGENMPTAPFIHGDIVRAVGWLQLPGLIHLYGDHVWKRIGEYLSRLYYCKDVSIEHLHFLHKTKGGEKEEYAYTNSDEMYKADHKIFKEYIKTGIDADVYKIKQRMGLL